MSDSEKRIALLIDADNAPAAKIDEVLSEVARFGVANVRRAYGNWKSPRLKGWESVLHEYAIRPIQQFAYSKGKNASDMAMVIDAMDLLYARNLDGFAIVSSDADFTPLVMRLLTDGVKVYGFGEKKTPDPFVNACSQFTYLEVLGQSHPGTPEVGPDVGEEARPRKSGAELRGDTRLVKMLRRAVSAAEGEDGWAHLGQLRVRQALRPARRDRPVRAEEGRQVVLRARAAAQGRAQGRQAGRGVTAHRCGRRHDVGRRIVRGWHRPPREPQC